MKSSSLTSANPPEKKIESQELYRGKSFSFFSDTVEFPDGRQGKRDYVKFPEAVGIVPFLDPKTVILVSQFRYAVGRTLWEIPAGKIEDPKENRTAAARRELLEETGYKAGKMDYLFSYYPCAGYSTEFIHIYRADKLTESAQDLDDDEFIRPEAVPVAKALEWIEKGKIVDAKTIISLLQVSRYRQKPKTGRN